MKKLFLKSISRSVYVGLFAGLAITGSFVLALITRCVIRAWHLGWLLLALLLAVNVSATPVYFPLLGITGSANNRDITVIPDSSQVPLIYGTNIVVLQTVTLHPTGGSATNNLLPWGYTIRVDGWPPAAHINVPNSTNLINVTSLITNAVAVGYPVSFGFNPTGFTGAVTNPWTAIALTTNFNVVTNNGWTLTLSAPAPFYFQAIYFENSNLTATAGGNVFGGSNSLVTLTLTTNEVRDGWMNLMYQAGATELNIDVPFVGVAGVGNYSTLVAYTNYTQVNNAISGATFFLTCVASNSVSYATNLVTHFNLTTFTNGVCLTNIFQ